MKLRQLVPLFAALSLASALFAADTHSKGPEVAQVSQGSTIKLTDYLVPGKTTIFDFSSDFCPPCRTYTQPLAQLHAKRDDIAVVRVDVNRPKVRGIDWEAPVVAEFGLQSIPHFVVYGPDGKLIAEDSNDGSSAPARMKVDQLIESLSH